MRRVERRRRSPGARLTGRGIAGAVTVLIVLAALAASLEIKALVGGINSDPNAYSVEKWEAETFLGKWLYGLGVLFRGKPGVEEENANLRRYLDLNRQINDLEQKLSSPGAGGDSAVEGIAADLSARRRERDSLTRAVEATIEGRITAVAMADGLTRDLGPVGRVVWPPVDLEFTLPPRTLVMSRRDRIELLKTTLLKPGLPIEKIDAIERDKLLRENVSALAFPLSGLGAYPTINEYPTDYHDAVSLGAHEWTHNFLAFRPLGLRYYKSNDLRTMNEVVANTVGDEVADAVVSRWPLGAPPPTPALPQKSGRAANTFDIGTALRQLRGEVDALLASGKVDQAEELMEQRRLEFASHGYFFRKINQAYFAFTNLYAGRTGNPGNTNPIGTKMDSLREKSGSLAAFVRIAGGFKSIADLDRALGSLP